MPEVRPAEAAARARAASDNSALVKYFQLSELYRDVLLHLQENLPSDNTDDDAVEAWFRTADELITAALQ